MQCGAEGDQLWLTLGKQPALELRPVSENVFRAVGVNAEVAFYKTEGVVEGLTLTQDGKWTTAERSWPPAGRAGGTAALLDGQRGPSPAGPPYHHGWRLCRLP